MNLENTFYLLGIIYMTLNVILLIIIVVFLFYFKKKVATLYESFEKKIEIAREIVSHPKETAATVGVALVEGAVSKIAEVLKRKKK